MLNTLSYLYSHLYPPAIALQRLKHPVYNWCLLSAKLDVQFSASWILDRIEKGLSYFSPLTVSCFLACKKRCIWQLSNRFQHPKFFQLKTALTTQKRKLPLGCRGVLWSWVMKRMYIFVEVLLPADPHYLYHSVEWVSSFLTMLLWKAGIEAAISEYSTKISFETIWLGRLNKRICVWKELEISVQLLLCKCSQCAFCLPLHSTYFWQSDRNTAQQTVNLNWISSFFKPLIKQWLWK